MQSNKYSIDSQPRGACNFHLSVYLTTRRREGGKARYGNECNVIYSSCLTDCDVRLQLQLVGLGAWVGFEWVGLDWNWLDWGNRECTYGVCTHIDGSGEAGTEARGRRAWPTLGDLWQEMKWW